MNDSDDEDGDSNLAQREREDGQDDTDNMEGTGDEEVQNEDETDDESLV